MAAEAVLWTADDLDRLPDDGNKYEVVDGRLLVNPPPSIAHERIVNTLRRLLENYVETHRVGEVFSRNDLIFDGRNRVDPDLSVIPASGGARPRTWSEAPRPVLVVEVVSSSSRQHDLVWKRDLYDREGIPLVWIVDPEARVVHVLQPRRDDTVEGDSLTWRPSGAPAALLVALPALFAMALGE